MRISGEFFGGENRFVFGDALMALDKFIDDFSKSVQLIYLDPPYLTGNSFTHSAKIGHSGRIERGNAYRDNMQEGEYYAFIRSVLVKCRELLKDTGAIYLHCDYRTSARTRLILEDVFGASNFVNEIIWHYNSGGRSVNHFSRKHDTIFFFRKGRAMRFDIKAVGVARGSARRNNMKKTIGEDGKATFSIMSNGKLYTYSEDSMVYPSDVWSDISHLQQKDPERTGYETQKPLSLLSRIICASSSIGDIVCDPFCGSGTTAKASLISGRRFLTCDNSPASLSVFRKRMLQGGELPVFSIDYLLEPPTLSEISYTVSQESGNITVNLSPLSAESLDYWSIGHCDGPLFVPMRFSMRTDSDRSLDLRLILEKASYEAALPEKTMCIQFTDAFGAQRMESIAL